MAQPRDPDRNVLIYDNDGNLLADLQVNTDRTKQYLTHEMLRRYCSWILTFPEPKPWQIVPLRSSGRPGRQTYDRHVQPGNYVVVAEDLTPLTVQLTDAVAPRRVRTRDTDSSTQGQNERVRLQRIFRDKLCARDSVCAVTGRASFIPSNANQYQGLQAAHIFPTSRITEWNRDNYRRWIDTTRPASEIGDTGIYSPQNGLLLSSEVHSAFDEFLFGVDPDADYKLIVFGRDPNEVGGTPLRDSARFGTAQNNYVSPELLRWHLRMCVYRSFKASAEPQMPWEDDLGEDDIGQILEQPDAAERMEVELYTRLGELIG